MKENSIEMGMLNMQAELLAQRLYITQMLCFIAGSTPDPESYIHGFHANMTDNVLAMNLPGVNDETAKLIRQRMQQFSRAIHQSALASVTHPDNPAAKAGKIRR